MEDGLNLAKKAAIEAGKILIKYYGHVDVDRKSDGSVVTIADTLAEKKIKSILLKEFPNYSFLGEESGLDKNDSEYSWVVDPLDGTSNFSIKNPFFNVSIALTKNRDPVLGVVFSPFQNELFSTVKGKGAFMNDKRINVSRKSDIRKATMSFCHMTGRDNTEDITKIFHQIKMVNKYFRQYGASALELCYVAMGRLEAFMDVGLKPWDVSAGMLMVRESEGKVTDFNGKDFNMDSKDLLASNKNIHNSIMELITKALD